MVTIRPAFSLPSWSILQIGTFAFVTLLCSLWAWTVILDQQSHSATASTFSKQYNQLLVDDHQRLLQEQALKAQKDRLQKDFDTFKSDPSKQKQATLDALFSKYADVQSKISRNNSAKLDTSSITNQTGDWGTKLLSQQFEQLSQSFDAATKSLDTQYQQYQASLITPTPKPVVPVTTGAYGYSVTTASTSRGNFTVHLIKMKLSEVTVKTVTANSSNCTNSCPTKSLGQYISENGAYAGMNGTYFCPPDYTSCAGKVNSYDFAVYNSNLGIWLNSNALGWDSEGLATFNGHSATFYRRAQDYDGHAVTAGLANFPPLLVQNGQVVTSESEQSAYQQQKGTKGAMGVDGTYIYLGLISNATMTESAYAMQALGARDVVNMDGGGSSAMYVNGAYKVGPGRSLPNAVVLVRN
jgi:hypothetical protein